MEKKVVVITGASGGLGKKIAKSLVEQGFQLALHSHMNEIDVPESDDVMHVFADLRKETEIEKMVDLILLRFGRVDVLINNAGISHSAMSWKTSTADWKETMDINLNAPFILSKLIIPRMRAQNSGRIINITSVVAQTGAVGTCAYAASKAGLIGLTKTLSKELAMNDITVNALALGYFNTGMIQDVPEDQQEKIIEHIPLRKLGDPETICETIKWLMSDASGYITGQVINLNGGMYA